ncbi:hypothetical protein J2Z48_002981 [Croceifilum oryzae]|uniref:Uncharacterized protein n=1 Tax=Croceifilum oryzae TaxID=1553429 RepID=A0AAJ1TKX4_9BACL|nr:hypothetical protein [Croceifilum oryzae]MDQ0418777.1 hypothetical protein [Croceifilum oryzae]
MSKKDLALIPIAILAPFLVLAASWYSTSYIYQIFHFLKWNIPFHYFEFKTFSIPGVIVCAAAMIVMYYLVVVVRRSRIKLQQVTTVIVTVLFLIPWLASFLINYTFNNSLYKVYHNHQPTNKVLLDIRKDQYFVGTYDKGVLLPCFSFEETEGTSIGGISNKEVLKPYEGNEEKCTN